ncbi:hypothetical protein L1887_30950 [Cichorium endivia]|nr:hypothetical protein L1887_30950 [Cichorium endivia]
MKQKSLLAYLFQYYKKQETNVPSLPPYPQMIFEAIDALKQKEGSNKSSILNYIESTYGNLPSGGTDLLTENLKNLKDSSSIEN